MELFCRRRSTPLKITQVKHILWEVQPIQLFLFPTKQFITILLPEIFSLLIPYMQENPMPILFSGVTDLQVGLPTARNGDMCSLFNHIPMCKTAMINYTPCRITMSGIPTCWHCQRKMKEICYTMTSGYTN